MSDLFHEEAKMDFIERCFMTMISADRHIYQILTKRPHKMAEFSKLFYNFVRIYSSSANLDGDKY